MKFLNPIPRRNFLGTIACAMLSLAVCHVAMPAAFAAETDAQKKWDSLSDSEKQALRDRWSQFKTLGADEQSEIRAAQARFLAMTDAERELVRKNFEQWKNLSPDEQKAIRDRYNKWRTMTDAEKAEFRANHKAFQDLADEEQKRLMKQGTDSDTAK